MKRALAVAALAVLCVSAYADDREPAAESPVLGGSSGRVTASSPFIGSGYRGDSTDERTGGYIGSDGRTATSDSGTWGSGTDSGMWGSGYAAREYRLFDGERYLRVVVLATDAGSLIVTVPE